MRGYLTSVAWATLCMDWEARFLAVVPRLMRLSLSSRLIGNPQSSFATVGVPLQRKANKQNNILVIIFGFNTLYSI